MVRGPSSRSVGCIRAFLLAPPLHAVPANDEQSDSDTDGGIRDIEGGIPLPGKVEGYEVKVYLYKIRDRSQTETVNQIAHSAAGYHAVSRGLNQRTGMQMAKQIDKHQRGYNGRGVYNGGRVAERAAHEARVSFVGQEEELLFPPRECDAALWNGPYNVFLGDLICDEHQKEYGHYPNQLSLSLFHRIVAIVCRRARALIDTPRNSGRMDTLPAVSWECLSHSPRKRRMSPL